MKIWTRTLGTALALTLASACGDDSDSDVGMTTSQERDASAPSDSSDDEEASDAAGTDEESTESDTAGSDDTAEETDPADPGTDPGSTDSATDDGVVDTDTEPSDEEPVLPVFEPPPPVLPDEDPETPISELDEDQFEQVCTAYLDTAAQLVESYQSFCAAQAVTAAQESGVTDPEEYRAACAEALAVCENEAAAAAAALTVVECSQEACSATLADFDGCRTQVSAVDAVIFAPIAALEAPACDEVTPAVGAAFSLRVAATVLVALAGVSEDGGEDPFSEDSPCDSIDQQCPGFAVPVGAAEAFEDAELDSTDAGAAP